MCCYLNRYLGIVGAEISLLKIEEVFRQILPQGVHGFMVNLADGTAMIHPNIKQSHEVGYLHCAALTRVSFHIVVYVTISRSCLRAFGRNKRLK